MEKKQYIVRKCGVVDFIEENCNEFKSYIIFWSLMIAIVAFIIFAISVGG